ncbi:hypothetical protein [Streptomyces mirabilis]|uniref:hypothetical protein n=1 Tax=Streptomyces mirabilis TaxID=68239 RepID=UPI0036ECC008
MFVLHLDGGRFAGFWNRGDRDLGAAQWSPPGGEVLPLPRAVVANGDFEQCRRFHVHREHRRTSATRFRGNSASPRDRSNSAHSGRNTALMISI